MGAGSSTANIATRQGASSSAAPVGASSPKKIPSKAGSGNFTKRPAIGPIKSSSSAAATPSPASATKRSITSGQKTPFSRESSNSIPLSSSKQNSKQMPNSKEKPSPATTSIQRSAPPFTTKSSMRQRKEKALPF